MHTPYHPPWAEGAVVRDFLRLLNMGPRSQNWVPVFAGLVDGSFASLQWIPVPAIGAPLDWAIQLPGPQTLGRGLQVGNWAIPIGAIGQFNSNQFPQFNEANSIGRTGQGSRD